MYIITYKFTCFTHTHTHTSTKEIIEDEFFLSGLGKADQIKDPSSHTVESLHCRMWTTHSIAEVKTGGCSPTNFICPYVYFYLMCQL